MAYANYHDIVVKEDSYGTCSIDRDLYEDLFVEHFEARDRNVLPVEPRKEITANASEVIGGSENERSLLAASGINAGRTLNVIQVIEYADNWVEKEWGDKQKDRKDGDPKRYNPDYGYYSSDCMNYVSQCLRAGGMLFDYGGTTTPN